MWMSYEQTFYWFVDKKDVVNKKSNEIEEAALWIKKGEVIAFPTETVYGLGGNALMEEAINKIYRAKGRPSDNPLIVHVGSKEQIKPLVKEVPAIAGQLMDAFWPGPLTIILKGSGLVTSKVTAGLDTIAVRIPDHPVAQALLVESGVPVAAPSANLSGKPSPTKAKHVYDDLHGKIRGIVDGGETGVGLESTVVDCTTEIPMILRPGGVTMEELEAVVGRVQVDPALTKEELVPKSPGVKYTHYAPNADLILVSNAEAQLQQLVNEKKSENYKVGILTTEENKDSYQADVVLSCGTRKDLTKVASNLYDILRQFNEWEVDYIFAETFPKEGVGAAIMDRLEKAAKK